VQIQVAVRSGSHPLLQISVSAASHKQLFLVDPQGGALTVRADGGFPGDQPVREALVGVVAPGELVRPTDGAGTTATMGKTVGVDHRGGAEPSR
jgi:hypothetical protein